MNPTQKEALEWLDSLNDPEDRTLVAGKIAAAAYRQLEAQRPRVWDAETISGAPEGKYNFSEDGGVTWETHIEDRKNGPDHDTGLLTQTDKRGCLENCAYYKDRGITKFIPLLRFFGPVAQPPAEGG